MMTYILFLVGFIGLSAIISFSWWVEFRVWYLKQDLFEIRDRLWDEARTKGFLNDPTYQQARNAINAMIRLSPRFCFPVWLHLARKASQAPKSEPSYIPEVRVAVQEAVETVRNYIFRRTLTGVMFHWMVGSAEDFKAEIEDTRRVIMSPDLAAVDRGYCRAEAMPSNMVVA